MEREREKKQGARLMTMTKKGGAREPRCTDGGVSVSVNHGDSEDLTLEEWDGRGVKRGRGKQSRAC